MVSNKYIDISIQNGFLKGVAGCLEHTLNLYELLWDARESARQIVVTWIDLANAYGSIMHNLVQFALDWYHVPLGIRRIIFSYYEQLFAMVVTANWQTDFFPYDIGLFQGCVMSTILFDITFNLLLDYLKRYDHLGYSLRKPVLYKLCAKLMRMTSR